MQISMQTRRAMVFMFGVAFLGFFAAWEVLNYWTSEVGLSMMMGLNPADPIWWIRLFAIGVVGLDIFHLAIFFFDRLIPGLMPEDANLYSWLAWGIVTVGDIAMSIFTFGYQFEVGVATGSTRGPQVFAGFLQYAPYIISVVVWSMTLFSIQLGRSFIASALGLKTPPRPQQNRQPAWMDAKNNKAPQPPKPQAQQFNPVGHGKQQPQQGRGPHTKPPDDLADFIKFLGKE